MGKTIEASVSQIEDIELIKQALGFGRLTPPLAEAARIRLENPDSTLAELGAMLKKPIGKSGMNHRLRRLAKLASELRLRDGKCES